MSRLRVSLSQRRVQAVIVLGGIFLVVAVVFLRLPRPVAAIGTLDQCLGGWPTVVFDGEDWKRALPDSLRAYAPAYLPIATWPTGLHFDETSGVLLDADRRPVFRKGDSVRIKGSVIEVRGDPSPCFYTWGVAVDEIGSP